ncbi:hypothetical protein JXA80_10115 [bacterium]|nr:hypothetical protein [candidate division CSSED10-310 bacterium]
MRSQPGWPVVSLVSASTPRTENVDSWRVLLLLIFLLPAIIILSEHPETRVPGFFADEAVYYGMTQSLADSGDLRWTRHDLESICTRFPAGPIGIILKQGDDGQIVYAKPVIYPLVAAPFFLLFGPSGILLLNMLAMAGMIRWIAIVWGRTPFTLIIAAAAIVFSAFFPYTLWYHPEVFTAFLLTGFAYYWIRSVRESNQRLHIPMALTLALATAIKPPLIIIGIPAAISLITRKRMRPILVCLLVIAAAGLLTMLLTGDINPYSGNRKIFTHSFPLDSPTAAFASGDSWSTRDAGFHFAWNVFGYNLMYFFIGRFTGLVWYFLPGLLAAALALAHTGNPTGRRILTCTGILALLQIILIPSNYHGGGGALGNRYFINLYPLLLISLPRLPSRRVIFPVLITAAVFSGSFLITPWLSSYQPGHFAKTGIYRFLPVEWTLTGAFPLFEPTHVRVHLPGIPGTITFLDRQTRGKENDGFSILAGPPAQSIIELDEPVDTLTLHAITQGVPIYGRIRSSAGVIPIDLPAHSQRSVTVPLGTGHHRIDIYGIDRWIHSLDFSFTAGDPSWVCGQPMYQPEIRFISTPATTIPDDSPDSQRPPERKPQRKIPLQVYNKSDRLSGEEP